MPANRGSAKKRAAPTAKSVRCKRARAANIIRQVDEQEELIEQEEQVERDVAEIITELLRDPSQVKGCKRAVMNGQWRDLDGKLLHDTIVKLERVPHKWKKAVLAKLGHKWQGDTIKSREDKNKGYAPKAFYRVTRTSPSDPVPSRDHATFVKFFEERMKSWDEVHKQLVQAMGTDDSDKPQVPAIVRLVGPGTHRTHIVHIDTEIQVEIPATIKVDASWKFTDTHTFKTAKLSSPKTVIPRVDFFIHTLFNNDDASLAPWFGGVTDWRYDIAAAPDTPAADAKEPAAAKVEAGPPETPRKGQDSEKLKKLIAKFRKA